MLKKELPKIYNPADYEDVIYKKWEKSGYFRPEADQPWADNLKREPYSIMMPPPNVTGVLHLGHALENSLMDIMARYQRMNGKKVLLLPGTDHAAVATQAKVEKILIEQGITNPRQELGREKLLEKIREYADNSKTTILKQIKKMGTSCDWSRLAYTFDEARNRAVNEVFVRMYNDGLIYRGKRIINWDAKLATTISDDEIVWQEEKAPLYYLKYGPFTIATARPETKFGDKYVVMHPDDKRYKKYKHGDKFDCEWINGQVTATVIKDEIIDPKFGSGVMTITPWHDLVDFEIAQRHDLNGEQIIDFNGKLMPIAGEFAGMNILQARPKIVEKLKAKGLVARVEENYLHRVAKGDRSQAAVEPQIKEQWFMDVNKKIPDKNKSLKDLMRQAVTTGHNGDPKQKVKITPQRFEKIYLNWINNLRDWCISRQIWWGHRIPVYYRRQGISNFQSPIFNKIKNSKFWELKIYGEDIFEAIKNRSKTIETRAGRKKGEGKYWGDFKTGDIIEFNLAEEKTDEMIKGVAAVKKTVKKVSHFKTIDQVFKNYKSEQDYPGKSIKEIKQWWEKRPALASRIKEYGIWAIELGEAEDEEIYVGVDAPEGQGWTQDEDTLDTWFSSGLWTFSTLGWPNKTPLTPLLQGGTNDLKTFHPTSWMQMGYEILFFWLARMILMSTYALDQIPFHNVYIHGMLRSETGKKFSKSSGDNIDPLEVIKKYGTDALRLSVISGIAPGNDSKFYEEKVEGARNMVNKLWNVARYIITKCHSGGSEERATDRILLRSYRSANASLQDDSLTLADKWILGKLDDLIREVTKDLDSYEFSLAGERLRSFTWDDLADWYLEVSKFEKNKEKDQILYYVLENLLKLWHPLMPFVTEAIWQEMGYKNLLMVEKWPVARNAQRATHNATPLCPPSRPNDRSVGRVSGGRIGEDFELVKEIVIAIRNARAENKVEPNRKVKAVIYTKVEQFKKLVENNGILIKGLKTGISELEIKTKGEKIAGAIYAAAGEIEIYLLGAVDSEKEKVRLEKEITNLEKVIKAAESKLANKEFVSKAPEAVVEKEREKLAGWQTELKKFREQLKNWDK